MCSNPQWPTLFCALGRAVQDPLCSPLLKFRKHQRLPSLLHKQASLASDWAAHQTRRRHCCDTSHVSPEAAIADWSLHSQSLTNNASRYKLLTAYFNIPACLDTSRAIVSATTAWHKPSGLQCDSWTHIDATLPLIISPDQWVYDIVQSSKLYISSHVNYYLWTIFT